MTKWVVETVVGGVTALVNEARTLGILGGVPAEPQKRLSKVGRSAEQIESDRREVARQFIEAENERIAKIAEELKP